MTLNFYQDNQELFAGCVSYWDGSVSGTTLLDIVGTNHGTINGATKTGTDRFGNVNRGFIANSGLQYITINKSAEPIGAKTILMYIKYPDLYPSEQKYIYDTSGSSWDNVGNLIRLYPTNLNLVGSKGTSGQDNYSVTGSFSGDPRGSYHLIGFTWDGTTNTNGVKLYINGIIIASTTAISVESTARTYNIKLLGVNSYSTWYYTGCLYELIIYNRALSATEIKTLYDITKTKYLYPLFSGGIRGVE